MQIHLNKPPGDILLFLTGQEEIDTACKVLFERMKSIGSEVPERQSQEPLLQTAAQDYQHRK